MNTRNDFTFPYLENNVFRSVARVMEDNPLTHRFLLLPEVFAGFGFLAVKKKGGKKGGSQSRITLMYEILLQELWIYDFYYKNLKPSNFFSYTEWTMKERKSRAGSILTLTTLGFGNTCIGLGVITFVNSSIPLKS